MADEVVNTPEKGDGEKIVTMTQAQFDAQIQSRLDRERKKFADYEELKTKAAEYEQAKQAQMTEAEKKEARIKELEAKAADLANQLTDREAKVLRVQVLERDGLPTSWADRVRGMTSEEIETDVAELKKLIGVKKPPVGAPVAPSENNGPPNMNDFIRGAYHG
jgi:SMC interacting uncharacterized protein involved in chromosome segregation